MASRQTMKFYHCIMFVVYSLVLLSLSIR